MKLLTSLSTLGIHHIRNQVVHVAFLVEKVINQLPIWSMSEPVSEKLKLSADVALKSNTTLDRNPSWKRRKIGDSSLQHVAGHLSFSWWIRSELALLGVGPVHLSRRGTKRDPQTRDAVLEREREGKHVRDTAAEGC